MHRIHCRYIPSFRGPLCSALQCSSSLSHIPAGLNSAQNCRVSQPTAPTAPWVQHSTQKQTLQGHRGHHALPPPGGPQMLLVNKGDRKQSRKKREKGTVALIHTFGQSTMKSMEEWMQDNELKEKQRGQGHTKHQEATCITLQAQGQT